MVTFTLTILPSCVLVPIAVASMVSTFLSSAERANVTPVSKSVASISPPYLNLRILDFHTSLSVIVFPYPRWLDATASNAHSTPALGREGVIMFLRQTLVLVAGLRRLAK